MNSDLSNSTKRFSDRVENYLKYRPHYPEEIFKFLQEQCGLTSDSVIADIGSGTGISAELLIANKNKVYAVEPNQEMRNAAENIFAGDKNFISIEGTAEDTTLKDDSVDFIICGQAFHWFDMIKCRVEFNRILRSGGYAVLMWNDKSSSNEFMVSYDDLVRKYGTDYEKINHQNIDDEIIAKFYSPGKMHLKFFEHTHVLDYAGLKGRLLSSSYIPLKGKAFDEMMDELKNIYEKNNTDGKVDMEYETRVYYGQL